MTTQPNLFSPYADTATAQPDLFGEGWAAETHLACDICDMPLVRTTNGYLACPRGHGRLMEANALAFETPGGFFDTVEG